jgi:O-antigen/teichoic acid export membrane protein
MRVNCPALEPLDGSAALHRAPADTGISRELLRGSRFLAVRYGLGVLVSLGNMLVMTWWIGPHSYGVFVTAIGIVAFLASLARGGVDTYLVRSEILPDVRMYGTARTVILASSLSLTLGAGAITPLLVRWFGSREFVGPYILLLFTIPVTGLTALPMAKLERALDFRNIAVIELAGQSAGLTVAILLAAARLGVWAPVMGQAAWQILTLVAANVYSHTSFECRFDRRYAREMTTYGLGLTASLRTWQLRGLVNPLLVGRFVGAEGVAFVALAIRIAESLGTFRQAAGRMAIAALARLQSNRDQFGKLLQQAVYLQVITLAPLLCAFSLLGPLIVPRLLGSRWSPSLAIFPFVAAGVLVNSVYNLQASALFVVGRQWVVTQAFAGHVALLATITFLVVPRCGIVGYGWAELVACCPYIAIHNALRRRVRVSYRQILPWLVGFALIVCSFSIAHWVRVLPR